MAYVPTGFPRGRPRKGEIRPPTPGALAQAKRRANMSAEEKQIQADYQRLWHLAHPGAKAASNKRSRQREVHWSAAQKCFDVNQFMRQMAMLLKK
jgi:hypothetical protein